MLITISNIYDMGQACKEMLEGLRKRVVVGQDKWTREQQKRYTGDLSSFFNILTTFNLQTYIRTDDTAQHSLC